MQPIRTVQQTEELLPYLFSAWPDTKKKQVREWLKHGAVLVNNRVITQFNHPLERGDQVTIRSNRHTLPDTVVSGGIKIRFEDETLLVVEKPSGLLSIASEAEREKTAYFLLTEHLRAKNPKGGERVWIVHRLDRETSGLMVFAKTPAAKTILQQGWDQFEKRYLAVVEGVPPKNAGTFDSHLDESDPFKVFSAPHSDTTRRAITHYKVMKRGKERSLVELKLETGRRHQIRVHLADAGCPIVGDEKYNSKSARAGKSAPSVRLALHSCFLKFAHPVTKKEMQFESALPKELGRLV